MAIPYEGQVPDQELCAAPEEVIKQLGRLYCIVHCNMLLCQYWPCVHGPHCKCHAHPCLRDAILDRQDKFVSASMLTQGFEHNGLMFKILRHDGGSLKTKGRSAISVSDEQLKSWKQAAATLCWETVDPVHCTGVLLKQLQDSVQIGLCGVTRLKSALDGRGTPVLGQQAGVDVQGPKSRDVQESLGQYVAICCRDAQIWLQTRQLSQKVCLFACKLSLIACLVGAPHQRTVMLPGRTP